MPVNSLSVFPTFGALVIKGNFFFFYRKQDAEKIFADAARQNMTGDGYAWIVTEQVAAIHTFVWLRRLPVGVRQSVFTFSSIKLRGMNIIIGN